MKTLKLLSFLSIFISLSFFSLAQETKTETIKVSGNCGMCKTRIEKAAKDAGAESADWSAETKMLTMTFNSLSVNAAKIQEAIAAVGHDTRDFRAADKAYDKLPDCCKYDREKTVSVSMQSTDQMKCCDAETNCGMDCCKDGNCSKHMETGTGDHSNHSMMMNCTMMKGKAKKVS